MYAAFFLEPVNAAYVPAGHTKHVEPPVKTSFIQIDTKDQCLKLTQKTCSVVIFSSRTGDTG